MGILGNLFGTKYDDERLCRQAEQAVAEDPIVNNPATIAVSSDKGVVMLSGSVSSEREKTHVENLVRRSLDNSSLKYERIDNQLRVG